MAFAPAINCPIDCGAATTSSFSRQFAKKTVANRVADLNFFIEYRQLTSGTSGPVVLGDINYTRNTYPTSATDIRTLVDFLPEQLAKVDSIEVGNSAILEQSETDPLFFEYRSSGSTTITATFNTNEKVTKAVTTSTILQAETQDVFVSFVSGSLGGHIFDQIRNYADDSTSSPNHYPLYSTFNQTNNSYVKNTGHWANALDFSGLMVNKSGSDGVTMVTAITPHHAIGVAHYAPQAGDIIYFCDSNNQTVAREVQSVALFAGIDCCVVRFTEALPPTVKIYKTLPANYKTYLPFNRNFSPVNNIVQSFRGSYLPIVICSHYRWDSAWPLQRSNRFAYIYQTPRIIEDEAYDVITYLPASNEPNAFPDYDGQPSGVRGGDSGGPCFFVINGDLVLVSSHFASTAGIVYPSFLSTIQSKIDELGPGGQIFQTVDLSGFTNFSS